MESHPRVSAGVLQFSDHLSDTATSRPARLSILPFDGESVTNENVSNLYRWSNGIAFQSSMPAKTPQPYPSLKNDQPSISHHTYGPLLRNIIWPMAAIILPIGLISGVLIGLVCGHRVGTEQNSFPSPGSANETVSTAYVLVNYSATRLGFLASWLSTMGPILAGFLMVLWSLPIAQTMRAASVELNAGHLPTPYQLSLIIGVTLASVQRLFRYYEYVLSSSHPRIPPVLHKAAMMLTLCTLLACGVFIADTALHYYTATVPFTKYSLRTQAMQSFSRGPSDECLHWNRSALFCFPCSVPLWPHGDLAAQAEAIQRKDEIFLLQYNSSTMSEIRLVRDAELENADLAILVPQVQTIPLDLDFRATTVGVTTQCSLITHDCNTRRTGNQNLDTQFNCSGSFYGILGLPPVMSDSGDVKDPNVPPLDWKPFQNLQYGYYTDPKLTQPHATGAFNSATDNPDLSGNCVPDVELINPVYLGLAGRFDAGESSASLKDDPGMLVGPNMSFVDFVLSCSYTTYEVNYTWFNGSIQNAFFTRSPNGTLAEMYHGSQMYATITGGAHDLELNMVQAAQQNNSLGFLREWGNLFSVKVLSSIGAYTTPRQSMQEQERSVLLVAKVPTIALWALMACSFLYMVLAFALGYAAFGSSSSNIQDLAARLSLAGLTAAIFEEKDGTGKYSPIINDADKVFSQQEDGSRRVGVEGLAKTGYILNPVISLRDTSTEFTFASSEETIC